MGAVPPDLGHQEPPFIAKDASLVRERAGAAWVLQEGGEGQGRDCK